MEDKTQITVRDVPVELRDQIKEIADQERRSMNGQILVALEEHVAQVRSAK